VSVGRLEPLNDLGLLWIVDDVLGAEACRDLIAHIERVGTIVTRDGTPRGTVRSNARHVETRSDLSELVYARVVEVVPPSLVSMQPVGANECIRFYRYQAGDFFKPHRDTHFMRSRDERSLLSVVVYLNDDFVGGQTDFPEAQKQVAPKPGRAAVFGHRMLHESMPIASGVKYAFRTDIMYRTS